MSNDGPTDAELDEDIRKAQAERMKRDSGMVSMSSQGGFDSDIYGGGGAQFTSTAAMDVDDDDDDDDSEDDVGYAPTSSRYGKSTNGEEGPPGEDDDDPFAETRRKTIAEREQGTYQAGRSRRMNLSPSRADMMSLETPAHDARKPADAALEARLNREEAELRAKLSKQEEEKKKTTTKSTSSSSRDRDKRERRDKDKDRDRNDRDSDRDRDRSSRRDRDRRDRDRDRGRDRHSRRDRSRGDRRERERGRHEIDGESMDTDTESRSSRKRKWDDTDSVSGSESATEENVSKWDSTPSASTTTSRWDSTPSATPSSRKRSRWDSTPAAQTESRWDATPARTPSRWDATPQAGSAAATTPRKEGSRWDETPVQVPQGMETPGATPVGGMGMATPTPGSMTPEQSIQMRLQADIDWRNRPLTDEELDEMIPGGYKIVEAPASYKPIHTPARKLMATPTPMSGGFAMQGEGQSVDPTMYGIRPSTAADDLPEIRAEDQQYFQKLIDVTDESTLTGEEAKEVKIMRLLLKIKNGTPPMRKVALRQITDRARDFGPEALFNHILPLLMSPTLEDQERHLLVKVIDRVLYKLDDLVRPYVHKILVVIMPLLIEEDYYARVEGREVISNLAKAAGLPTMIAVMRPDIDDQDEYVRNTTARAFAVVASALGVASLLPFLKVVCMSKSSWQARHTGIKIVMQIAQLMGPATLPYLKSLVTIVEHGLKDQEHKVRTITALAIAALAEAAYPYGIESFDSVLKPLWYGINEHRGKGLAAFLKAIGFIIPLMDAEYASHYTIEVMRVLIREFRTPEDDMKKIVLKVVKQCVSTEGVEAKYIRTEILPPFCKHFWISRMAMDRRNYRALVETTVSLAHKVGAAEIISSIVQHLKADGESYRKMVCETIDKVITEVGAADIDTRLEELLIDGIIYAFQEQVSEDARALLGCFGTITNAMGLRVKPYLPQIVRVIKWRLSSKQPKVREQAADLISKIAQAMKVCQEEKLMGHLGVVLYEYLGEEYPDVLGSILGGLKAIVNVIGMTKMTPPIKDLLPRLTPILKNRHEKVQENVIDLVGRIADRGHEFVSEREWMRICFELLETLKAHKKGIRRAAVNCFGYIAKAIGPQDVLATLLNNLRVQERQNRVCTTVAIAIVAETCEPYTVIPALMNEYRVPELNVQNGVLKAFSFMFEYISELGKDYVYAVVPLLQDALMDRDAVHRQTAMTVVKHIGLGVTSLGCEDAMLHLFNFVWPNVFETSPHVHNAFMNASDGARMSLGVAYVCQYLWSGIFHPARKVRGVYWKVYNNAYIANQDAMVPCYPTLLDEPKNCYYPAELNMFI